MTYIDISTQYDLEELQKYYDEAETKRREEEIALRMAEIISERGDSRMRKYRDMLIKAVRAGDRRTVRFAQENIKRIELDRKYGRASV